MSIKQITTAGTVSGQPPYLKNKIILANTVALMVIFFVATPFIIISYFFFNPLTYLPALAAVLLGISIWVNYVGLHYVGRLIIALAPMLLASVYSASISMASEGPVVGIYLIQFSFAFIPLIIFDYRERFFFLGTMGIGEPSF